MSIDHSPVECELHDYYAGDWVDALDELKLSIDERRVIANAGAYALGRKTDELIIEALNKASSANDVGNYTSVLSKKISSMLLPSLTKMMFLTTASALVWSARTNGILC